MKFKFVVNEDFAGKTIAQFLYAKGFSNTQIKKLKIKIPNLFLNGKSVYTSQKIACGDLVEFELKSKTGNILPVNEKFDILFEDDFLLAINKPPHLATIPHKTKPSLAQRVAYYLETNSVMPISRLDFDTSGVVLFAKTPAIQHMLTSKISKTYLAFCAGIPKQKSFLIDKPIAVSPEFKSQRIIDESGKPSQTKVELKKIFGNKFCLLELKLLTGRTHQIRVHLNYENLPILGDKIYGTPIDLIDRQALHAKSVEFVHPFTNKKIKITAPFFNDLKDLENSLDKV